MSDQYRKSPAQLNRYREVIGAFLANPDGYCFHSTGRTIKTATVDLSFLLKALIEDSNLRAETEWTFDQINRFFQTYVFKAEVLGVIAVRRKRLASQVQRYKDLPPIPAYEPTPIKPFYTPDELEREKVGFSSPPSTIDRSVNNDKLLHAVCVCLTHELFKQPVEFHGYLTEERQQQLQAEWPSLAFIARDGLTVIL